MYFNDHLVPHLHARAAGHKAKVRIDKIEVIESNLARKQIRMVCDWAALHQIELEENWQRARAGATLRSIEPWR